MKKNRKKGKNALSRITLIFTVKNTVFVYACTYAFMYVFMYVDFSSFMKAERHFKLTSTEPI